MLVGEQPGDQEDVRGEPFVGPAGRILTSDHGQPLASELAPLVIATVHPSAVLRARGGDARDELYAGLVSDLRMVALAMAEPEGRRGARSRPGDDGRVDVS